MDDDDDDDVDKDDDDDDLNYNTFAHPTSPFCKTRATTSKPTHDTSKATNDFVKQVLNHTHTIPNSSPQSNTPPASYANHAHKLDNGNPWTQVPHKGKTPTPNSSKDDVWDNEDIELLNESDDDTKLRRVAEGRDDLDREVIWINWLISTEARPSTTPTVIEFEHILDKIIAIANLPFSVDRAWLRSKKKTFLYRNIPHVSTYAALCPTPSTPHDDTLHRQRLELLNTTLFKIINTENILKEKEPNAIINYCEFSIPVINHWNQTIHFIIKGLHPNIILVDNKIEEVFTQRELAVNIYRAFIGLYTRTCVEKPLHHLKQIDLDDTTSITNIMSVRKKNFDEAKSPIFTIVISDHTEAAEELIQALTELCITREIPLYIGGDKTKIELLQPPPKSALSHRLEFFKLVTEANMFLLPDRTKEHRPILLRDIRAPPTITKHPSVITLLANHKAIKGCEGIFINLRLGPNSPTITLLLKSGKHAFFLKKETVEDIINIQLGHIFEDDPQPVTSSNIFEATPNTLTSLRRGGRGRGRGSTSSQSGKGLFNTSSIGSIIRITVNVRWHAIFNGRGGSGTSNIYRCDFDSSGLRLLVNGVPYEKHKSFDTYDEAFAEFIFYFPDIETQEDIDRMNANAPLEASNLNNPSPIIRRLVGDYKLAQLHSTEEDWTYNTYDDTIKSLRTASSDRMRRIGASPTDSFDFLDDKLSRLPFPLSVAPITLQSIQLFINDTKTAQKRASVTPLPPHRSPPRITTDNASTMNISHIQTPLQHLEDDTLSQLSNVSISKINAGTASVSGSALQSSPKRRRQTTASATATGRTSIQLHALTPMVPTTTAQLTTPTFINFVTDTNTQANNIRNLLLEAHTAAITISTEDNNTKILPFPYSAISSRIHFAMIPGSTTTKLGLVRINEDEHTDSVARLVQSLPTTINDVFVSSIQPATGFEIHHIDDSSPQHNTVYPLNCRIIGCQLHNHGREPNPPHATNILESLAEHYNTYHQDLITDPQTPLSILGRIGWFKCNGCPSYHFTKEKADEHMSGCKRNEYKDIIQMCPKERMNDLLMLIDNNTDKVTIKCTFLDWMMESSKTKASRESS
jgi:hypothetical protein